MSSLNTFQNCVLLGIVIFILRSVGNLDNPMVSNVTTNTANKGVFSKGEVLKSNGHTSTVRVIDRYGQESVLQVTGDLREGTSFIGGRSSHGRFYAK
jgi:hypothetical protein